MEPTVKDIKSKMDQMNPEKKEGPVASMIEEQTSKIPSDMFLWASVGAMAVSLGLKAFKKDQTALFVGMWAPVFLLFGIYNKQVKQMGHDRTEKR
jgi:hypothetical protein